jgi:tRNA pseudouridine13 synthase
VNRVDERVRAAVVDPPRGCDELPGIGGVVRARPEDFAVEELPSYPADEGAGAEAGHALVWMRKRSLTTEEAVREVARYLKIDPSEIGLAGLKDRDAVTRQQISVPARSMSRIDSFRHAAIELSDARPHSHKLRRGHLRGNRFVIVVRELSVDVDEALRRAEAKLARLAAVGLRNYYGAQRFGEGARNLEPGLASLAGRRRRHKGDLSVSAGQSALFNAYLAIRAERGLIATALPGDILQKRDSGGMFECKDPTADQLRLDAGELVVTGPMYGSKMRAPSTGTAAAALEDEVLALAGLDSSKLAKLGRNVPGTRRQLLVWPSEVGVTSAGEGQASAERGPGLQLQFCLPAGSYATVLLRELCN